MIRIYKYELWNGHRVMGEYCTTSPLLGKNLVLPTISELKRPYNRKIIDITIPIITRCVKNDGVDYTIRRCLDVRKKSKRQIEIIKNR